MPRLEGQPSNTGRNIILLLIVLVVIILVLELVGAINLIPGFGPS